MHIDFSIGTFWPLIHSAAMAVAAAVAYRVCVLTGRAADAIHDQRVRAWVTTLIQAAESTATSPTSGPQKKEWVISRVLTLFPRLNRTVVSDLVEGLLTGVRQAAPRTIITP